MKRALIVGGAAYAGGVACGYLIRSTVLADMADGDVGTSTTVLAIAAPLAGTIIGAWVGLRLAR